MTLYKRNGIYYVESKKAGRKRVSVSTGARNLREAKKFADSLDLATRCPTFELAVEFLRRFYETTEGKTLLSEAWTRYEEVAKSVGKDKVAKQTWRLRRERVAKVVAWMDHHHPGVQTIEEITGVYAAEFAADLAKTGLKGKTRKCIICDLSTVWTLLAKVSPNLPNPWKGLSPKADDSVRGEPFTDADAAAVLEAAGRVGKEWPLACLIAKHTGLRYGDVATLKWSSIDLDRCVIRAIPGKTDSFNIAVAIPIHPVLLESLREAQKRAVDAPEGSALKEYVVPRHALAYGDAKRWKVGLDFAAVLKEAKVSGNYTFHSWRHYFRTRLAAAKVPTETAMRLCGHTNEAMSHRYDHDEHLDELRAAVTAAFA